MIKDSIGELHSLPKFLDERGNLSFLQNGSPIPFEIKRVHWLYDVPGGETRGGLAYKETQEFIIALSGSFDLILDDGRARMTYSLNRSYKGIYVPGGIWRAIDNFSTNSVALIVASTLYNPEDAIRDYQEYKKWRGL